MVGNGEGGEDDLIFNQSFPKEDQYGNIIFSMVLPSNLPALQSE